MIWRVPAGVPAGSACTVLVWPPGLVVTTMNCVLPVPVEAVESLGTVVMILVGCAPATPDFGAAMTMVCLPAVPAVPAAVWATIVAPAGRAMLSMDVGMVLMMVLRPAVLCC